MAEADCVESILHNKHQPTGLIVVIVVMMFIATILAIYF